MATTQSYFEIAKAKRDTRDQKIPLDWRIEVPVAKGLHNVTEFPSTCGILTDREVEITSRNDAVDILNKIRTREYSAVETAIAFCKRAAIAQQLTNCLTEIFFDEAIERARELDREQAANPALRPLHGLPISLKDPFRVPGVDSTTGLICWVDQPDTYYSSLPRLLLDLGAVLYCKTNIPQTMLTLDSDNNVFGRTLNPYNLQLTAGGSSGGEGSLIALRGSILGIGTDIAGSIRIPALCCGTYGFKPSNSIVPYGGLHSPSRPGNPGVVSSAGPMATSMRSISYFMKAIMEAKPWRYDATCIHLPWTGSLPPTRLRIGLLLEDSFYTPWPPVRRTIAEAARKLQDADLDLVPVELPEIDDMVTTLRRLYALDGAKFMHSMIDAGKEPPVQSVRNMNMAGTPASTLDDLYKLNVSRLEIQQAYHKMWMEHELDAILMPTAPNAATPFNQWLSVSYTAIWNFLDYPAFSIPWGSVQAKDKEDALSNASHGEQDERNYQLYTGPADFQDAPLGVQVVGMKHEDEALTHIASTIDKILHT